MSNGICKNEMWTCSCGECLLARVSNFVHLTPYGALPEIARAIVHQFDDKENLRKDMAFGKYKPKYFLLIEGEKK